ncbi:MAG: hypothetical protein H0X04_03825 [Chthoniobacterales bacterium]|nr:hypothetical protein [Chthoniobacterales bacterium]
MRSRVWLAALQKVCIARLAADGSPVSPDHNRSSLARRLPVLSFALSFTSLRLSIVPAGSERVGARPWTDDESKTAVKDASVYDPRVLRFLRR